MEDGISVFYWKKSEVVPPYELKQNPENRKIKGKETSRYDSVQCPSKRTSKLEKSCISSDCGVWV